MVPVYIHPIIRTLSTIIPLTMASKISFQEALNLFTIDGKVTLTPQQAATFSSLFAPTSEDEVLSQVSNSEIDFQQLKNLVDSLTQNAPNQNELLSLLYKINTSRNESMSKNTLYHILKNSNRLSVGQFDGFLNYLGMNTDHINIKQFVDRLTQMYQ